MINHISVVMIAKNAEQHIEASLESITNFNEVILYINNSTDKTEEIAKQYPNVTLIHGEFTGFGTTKKRAVSYARNDWILSLDSDEVLSKALIKEINKQELNKNKVYSILRNNYYKNKWVKCCGWNNNYVERLFNRTMTNFNTKEVHEGVITDNLTVEKLKNALNHYPFDNAGQLLSKMDSYATLYAKEHQGHKKSSPFKAFFSGFFAFLKNYFLQKGFLCGYTGLLISISNANGAFYKYIKLYEANKK
ncbi:MAG: Putative two-domain glycosyltransferase [uncultured Sulfurovum sp.]|uniref:Two-domain glycosyltransferase n=1 Tax=uncultured Sulfurovum sp. TaxID=269237 RepID=A0A6S6TKX2_9BACT|nr:MAG: Putative two-domain glycosyltransferase [uncultured Sulfurovum sp.]